MEEFGAWLRERRGGRTQRSVEQAIGMPHGIISRAERGLALMTTENLRRLCAHYRADFKDGCLRMAGAHHARHIERTNGK
jgi:transcriptional regulator with XRE-family HTH domain